MFGKGLKAPNFPFVPNSVKQIDDDFICSYFAINIQKKYQYKCNIFDISDTNIKNMTIYRIKY